MHSEATRNHSGHQHQHQHQHQQMYSPQYLEAPAAVPVPTKSAHPSYPQPQHHQHQHQHHPFPQQSPTSAARPEQAHSPFGHTSSHHNYPPPAASPSPYHAAHHSQYPHVPRPHSLHSSPYQPWAAGTAANGMPHPGGVDGRRVSGSNIDVGRRRYASDSPTTVVNTWHPAASALPSDNPQAHLPQRRSDLPSPITRGYAPEVRTYPPPHVHGSAPVSAPLSSPQAQAQPGSSADGTPNMLPGLSDNWPRRSISDSATNSPKDAQQGEKPTTAAAATTAATATAAATAETAGATSPSETIYSTATAKTSGSKRQRDTDADKGTNEAGNSKPKIRKRITKDNFTADDGEDSEEDDTGREDNKGERQNDDKNDNEAAKILEERRRRNANASARFRKRRNERERELVTLCLFLEQQLFERVGLKAFDEIMAEAPKVSGVDGMLKRRPIPSTSSIASPISAQLTASQINGLKATTTTTATATLEASVSAASPSPSTIASSEPGATDATARRSNNSLSVDSLTAPQSVSDVWAVCLELKEQMGESLERIRSLEVQLQAKNSP
ncbi:hypothetical protein GGI12_001974 [Dipsacomyces acuminosporus]|nr:hypothetical protein GGI12_001974 [Dipsacomyces acuminosporus]